jgi:hypothetical protein
MTALVRPTLWDSVGTAAPIDRKGILTRWSCAHLEVTKFTHIDHRVGPGSFADTWHGLVCVRCGEVTEKFLADDPCNADLTKRGEPWPWARGPERDKDEWRRS